MLGKYYYHEVIRRTNIAFATLFNDIHIRHRTKGSNNLVDIKVPLSYGPTQKFLARLNQQPSLERPVQKVLPRMSFEMTNIQYDPSRKTSITQTFKACDDGGQVKKVFLPVPYNIGFQLSMMSKIEEDTHQVVEQILPFFQPAFNLTVDLIDSIGEKRDVPVILDSVSFTDDYEGDFSSRRVLIYTFNFTVKTYLFGPISDSTDGLIRKVQVDMYSNTDIQVARRELRYTVTPDPIDAEPTDTYGYNESIEDLFDALEYSPTQQTDIP